MEADLDVILDSQRLEIHHRDGAGASTVGGRICNDRYARGEIGGITGLGDTSAFIADISTIAGQHNAVRNVTNPDFSDQLWLSLGQVDHGKCVVLIQQNVAGGAVSRERHAARIGSAWVVP